MPKHELDKTELRRRYFPATQTRAEEKDGEKKIEGHAALFDTPAWIPTWFGGFREYVRDTAFNKTLADGADVRGLFNHDANEIFARTREAENLTLSVDDKGLFYNAVPIDETGEKVYNKVRTKLVTQNSFGFQVINEDWGTEIVADRDGKEVEVEFRELLEVKLLDISPVVYAAYSETEAYVRSIAMPEMDDLTTYLRALATGRTPEVNIKNVQDQLTTLLRGLKPSDDHSDKLESVLNDTNSLRQSQLELEMMFK